MGLKVAVIGLSPSSIEAPWDDPTWEKWGLPWDFNWARLDRLFEMHDMRLLVGEHSRRSSGYLDRLRGVDVPLYMQERYFLSATKFPFGIARGISTLPSLTLWHWPSTKEPRK